MSRRSPQPDRDDRRPQRLDEVAQDQVADRLRLLLHLSLELNRWRVDGCVGELPQKHSFGLHLPPLERHEVWWPS